jgi:hypothetical protein
MLNLGFIEERKCVTVSDTYHLADKGICDT